MAYTVPVLSIVFMAVVVLTGIVTPIILFIILKKKYHTDSLPFFIGCAVFIVFALLLEGTINRFILTSGFGTAIKSNILVYGIFGGLMAGLFEETGRYIAFKTVLKRRRENDRNALMYGAGHGGFEACYILVFSMTSYIVMAIKLNAGMQDTLTASITDAATLQSLNATFVALASTPSAAFLMSIVERIAAVVIQISLSVLVWFAVKNGGKFFWFYPLALLIHALVDAVAVIMASYISNTWIMGVIYAIAAGCALFAGTLWKKCSSNKGILAEIKTGQEA